jgi:hypothetical protein
MWTSLYNPDLIYITYVHASKIGATTEKLKNTKLISTFVMPYSYDLTFEMKLSVRGSVTNNNGFWIGLLDLLALVLLWQPIITAHSQWLPKTRSIPCWTTGVFSSAVTDLVLIYESVTSSASVVRWLTLHSWPLNYWTAFSIILRLNDEWTVLNSRIRVRVTLRLAVYRQSVRLGDKPLETHDKVILFSKWTFAFIAFM